MVTGWRRPRAADTARTYRHADTQPVRGIQRSCYRTIRVHASSPQPAVRGRSGLHLGGVDTQPSCFPEISGAASHGYPVGASGVGLRREGFCARVKHTPTTVRPGVPRCSAETFAGSCSTPCLVLYRGRSLVIRVGVRCRARYPRLIAATLERGYGPLRRPRLNGAGGCVSSSGSQVHAPTASTAASVACDRQPGLRGLAVTVGPRRRHGPAATGSSAPATSRRRRGFGAGRRCRSSR